MSKNFSKVKRLYANGTGSWTKDMVRAAVGRWITAEEYEMITGEAYEDEE